MPYAYEPVITGVDVGYTSGSYNPNWVSVNGNLAYTGAPAVGTWVRIGNVVQFTVKVTMTTVTNFGTGQYRIDLPFQPVNNYAFRDGGLHEGTNHYGVLGDAYPTDLQLRMKYVASNGKDQDFTYNSPHLLTTADFWYLSGTYEAIPL